jgi:hypothetical protein
VPQPGLSLWTRQQFGNLPFQVIVGRNPDGILDAAFFQGVANIRLGKDRVDLNRNFLTHSVLPSRCQCWCSNHHQILTLEVNKKVPLSFQNGSADLMGLPKKFSLSIEL